MDNCAAMVESSSVFRHFTGTGVLGDSGTIAALQSAPFAPTARNAATKNVSQVWPKDCELYFRLLVEEGPSGNAMARIF